MKTGEWDYAADVAGVGLWIPGYRTTADWAAGHFDAAVVKPAGRALDRVNRRRAGRMGRAIADAAADAMEMASAEPATIATIVGSAIGEANTMIGLLEQMWRTKTPLSPAAFTVSVHNAASGLLSISSHNVGYATSLAADADTPGAALLEALGLLATGEKAVLVVCADEETPRNLLIDAPQWDLLAGALVLVPRGAAVAGAARLSLTRGEEITLPPVLDAPSIANSPQAGIADLVDAILQRRRGVLALDRGTGLGFQARLENTDPA